MKKKSLKNENGGAALLAVLVILVVVSIIAVVITKITLTNIQMREVERSNKANFYDAESIMDELYAGANEVAAEQMSQVYQDILKNYLDQSAAGTDLQALFRNTYISSLKSYFEAGSGSDLYKVDTLKLCIATEAHRPCLVTQDADAAYTADSDAGTFTLKNVRVTYKDDRDYETTITADLVFSTPQMNFSGGQQMKDFMKYALIADRKIEINASPVTVNGNVYAGDQGLEALTNGKGTLSGNVFVTRGDIVLNGGSELTLGDGKTQIWAENIETKGKSSSTLNVDGNCYVADDLTLNGTGSKVTLKGNYYGYNFQEDYAALNTSRDARFSSAVMINAKDSKLDMQNLSYLMLAGRTFISRGTYTDPDMQNASKTNSDILMGESLSVRTNQLAYYVPSSYVDAGTLNFTTEGLSAFAKDTGIRNVADYLPDPSSSSKTQVSAYHYKERGRGTKTYYYLNFADEQKANDYFAAYSAANSSKVNGYAERYLADDAILVDDDHIFTLRGDLMYRDTSDQKLKEETAVVLDGSNRWDKDGAYWNVATRLAVQYKSLELGLNDSGTGITASDVRLRDGAGKIDKSVSSLFQTLIDQTALEDQIAAKGSQNADDARIMEYRPVTDDARKQAVLLVDNAGESAYRIPDKYTGGIVVATGDVYVLHDFNGVIISGGTIRFANNAKVTSDEMMVLQLFTDDVNLDTPLFSQFFRQYAAGGVSQYIAGEVDLKNYLNYDNWKKN